MRERLLAPDYFVGGVPAGNTEWWMVRRDGSSRHDEVSSNSGMAQDGHSAMLVRHPIFSENDGWMRNWIFRSISKHGPCPALRGSCIFGKLKTSRGNWGLTTKKGRPV